MGSYSDEQIETFITLAQEIGPAAAMKELGYPKARASYHAWLKKFNITIDLDDLKVKADRFNKWYREREQALVLSTVLERIMESMELDNSPEDLVKLSRAAKDTIESLRLISGQSTHNIEIDTINSHLNGLLRQFKVDRDEALAQATKKQLEQSEDEPFSIEHWQPSEMQSAAQEQEQP